MFSPKKNVGAVLGGKQKSNVAEREVARESVQTMHARPEFQIWRRLRAQLNIVILSRVCGANLDTQYELGNQRHLPIIFFSYILHLYNIFIFPIIFCIFAFIIIDLNVL